MVLPCLFVAETSGRGRGVFTSEPIQAGTVVEIAPVIVMESEDRQYLDKTLLHDYIFEWNPERNQCCMALGYVPIYNHSHSSNCEYDMDYEHALITIKAMSNIQSGEELFINYNGDWNDARPVWFELR